MKKVILLGASGNIGSQTLDILKKEPENFELVGISVGNHIEKIEGIVSLFPSIKSICVKNLEDESQIKEAFPNLIVYSGDDGLLSLIEKLECDMVVNALVGFAGLLPSLKTLELNKILCLANKESLVVGGSFIKKQLDSGHGKLYPIDSEHVALAKLLSKFPRQTVSKLIITASGGAFRNLSRSELIHVTPEMALNHPTWSMGPKITIDSATMMNKGFEVIEAKWLYDFPLTDIEVLLHDESHVHSLLLLKDGSYAADISEPDMHTPIDWALHEGNVPFTIYREKEISAFGPYHFHKFDAVRFPAVDICLEAYKMGGTATAVLNASNEVADLAFLNKKISFLDIENEVRGALRNVAFTDHPSLRDILRADSAARLYVSRHIEGKNK